MQGVSTWFWFDGQAEQAATFYADLFGGKVTGIERTPEGTPFPAGDVMTASFRILGHGFHALNGGPKFEHTSATFFMVPCDDQAEIDRYGITWQIVPSGLQELLSGGGDPAASQGAWQAMMPMVKLDIGVLEAAARG